MLKSHRRKPPSLGITIPRVNNNRRSRLYLINPDSSFSALFSCKMAGDVSRVFLNLSEAQPEQRYTYRVLQTIQMKLILLCVWAERAVLGSAKTTLKFKYEI